MRKWLALGGMGGIAVGIVASALAAAPASVTSFSPQGTVKGIRQVRANFSEQMVPFGDPRSLADPFIVDCPVKGTSRWADQKNWNFDFESDLPGGVRCTFRLRPELKTLAGRPLEGQKDFSFSTGGPAVQTSMPWDGSQVREDQIFILTLDAKPDEASVAAHAYFQAEGIQEPIPIQIITGKLRDEILKSQLGNAFSQIHRRRSKKGASGWMQPPAPEWWVIQAKRSFPADAKVKLVWGKGIESAGHVPTEQDQTLAFKVRPAFSARFNCERENPKAGCIPFLPLRLSFSAEVPKALAKKIRLRGADGKTYKSDIEVTDEGNARDVKMGGKRYRASYNGSPEEDADPFVSTVTFEGPFPEKSDFSLQLPAGLKDEAGRALINQASFPLSVHTDEYPPLAKFAAPFGIVESKPEGVLPVTLRNVEPEVLARAGLREVSKSGGVETVDGQAIRVDAPTQKSIREWVEKVNWQGQQYHAPNEADHRGESILGADSPGSGHGEGMKVTPLRIKKPGGHRAFEVVGIPLRDPGFYVVQLESRLLGEHLIGGESTFYVSTAVLVTNLSVHFKWGREASLAWVTSLDEGRPVDGALVAVRDCRGELLGKGKSDAQGLVHLPGFANPAPYCQGQRGYWSDFESGLFVSAEKGGDFSFVHSSWERGIEPWRFQLPSAEPPSPKIAHTVFDRTLFRAGETVHMKHFVRVHTMAGFSAVDRGQLPKVVQIEHQGSNQKYELPLKWEPGDVAESTWTIPKSAKLGTYEVRLLQQAALHEKKKGDEEGEAEGEGEEGFHFARGHRGIAWDSGSFRVEEYRVPLMKGRILPPKDPLVGATSAPVDLSVEYLAGGTAAMLPVQVRFQQLVTGGETFPGFDDYTFDTGKFRLPKNPGEEPDSDELEPQTQEATELNKVSLNLDKTGTSHADLKGLKKLDRASELAIELEYRDPNGEVQTSSTRVPMYPSRRLVGIKPDSWFTSVKSFKFSAAVIDLKGRAVGGAPVEAEYLEQVTTSHRKRLVGGFYSYENHSELKPLGKACSGKTNSHGLFFCETPPPHAGNLIVQVRTKDEQGNTDTSFSSMWVYDEDRLWFAQDDSERIDLLPERKRYESGETAKFQVRMPFAQATALVTVEREGVIDSFVTRIDGKKPMIEVPIKPNYAPNVFVSALVVRGRVGDVQPTALIDLGKPAYKLGIAEIHVGWKPHELSVRVTPAREVYRVREKAAVKVQVARADGGPVPEGAEMALAAVDEGLLLLKPNESWKLLEAMMNPRGYEVMTSTAQMQVIGKRHYGLKALPNGGDGGKAPTRELFDSLLLWKGRVKLDSRGEATVEVPLNDSLSSFRIVAVAHAALGYFGTGSGVIRTTQDLMLLSGIPPLVREGDRFQAELTLRNTTSAPLTVDLKAQVKGLASALPARRVELAANEAKTVGWPIEVPAGVQELTYDVEAGKGKQADHLRISQKVIPAVPVRVYQATLTQLDPEAKLDVERPKDALKGRGGVRAIIQPSLLTGLDGVRDYMRDYLYTCLEQRISVAVALRDEKLWKNVSGDIMSYLDQDGLARYFPVSWIEGSDTLTAYVLSIVQEAAWSLPDSARGKMLDGLAAFVEGRIIRGSGLKTADLSIRKIAAIEALSRYGRANPSMLASVEIAPNLWPTSAVIDWLQITRRLGLADAAARRSEALQILRSRLNFQGTIMTFSTESSDRLWWLMISPDENANRLLLSVLDLPDEPGWPALKEDMGRLARGAVYRQKKGHWDTTTANAWGVLAYEKFAEKFEKEPVAGETRGDLQKQSETLKWAANAKGKTLRFDWPESGKAELKLRHAGSGKPWVTFQSLAAIPLKEPFSSGYRINKSWSAVERKDKSRWSRGDIVRVRLELEAQSDMTWVVVNDPIPAGAAILGGGLGNDSSLSTRKEKSEGAVWPIFEERAFDGYRAYYEFVPKGRWTLEYTVRLNQAGTMGLPATRAEAMYAPEMLGEVPNHDVTVGE